MSERVTVLGAGSWGTALAVHCGRVGHDVRLWGRDRALVDEMVRARENAGYLPGIRLGDSVTPVVSLDAALEDAPMVIAAVPSHGMRYVLREAAPRLRKGAILVSATKGLETDSLDRMSQLMAEEAGGHPIAVLSGPSFALEVARGMPTAVVVASADAAAVTRVQDSLKGPTLRLYASDDVTGVELEAAKRSLQARKTGGPAKWIRPLVPPKGRNYPSARSGWNYAQPDVVPPFDSPLRLAQDGTTHNLT